VADGCGYGGRIFFNWFDHPLIEAWLEQLALRPELHCQHTASPKDRQLERLEVPVIEALPDVAREAIERLPVDSLDRPAPALDHGRRRG